MTVACHHPALPAGHGHTLDGPIEEVGAGGWTDADDDLAGTSPRDEAEYLDGQPFPFEPADGALTGGSRRSQRPNPRRGPRRVLTPTQGE